MQRRTVIERGRGQAKRGRGQKRTGAWRDHRIRTCRGRRRCTKAGRACPSSSHQRSRLCLPPATPHAGEACTLALYCPQEAGHRDQECCRSCRRPLCPLRHRHRHPGTQAKISNRKAGRRRRRTPLHRYRRSAIPPPRRSFDTAHPGIGPHLRSHSSK